MELQLERVIVVGTSCSGKTTFSDRLAKLLNQRHIQLDSLYWDSNWVVRPQDEFCAQAKEELAADRWIADGNYSAIRNLMWSRATSVVWLNYSFPIIFSRALSRTIRRIWFSEEIFSNNKESFYQAFLSKKSILWWVITTYQRRRRDYRKLRETNRYQQLTWFEFRNPLQAESLLKSLAPAV